MITPKERIQDFVESSIAKLHTKASRVIILAILGGMFAAFGCVGYEFARFTGGSLGTLLGFDFGKILGALVFPLGTILIIMAGAELFMGNCLMVMPLFTGKVHLRKFLKHLVLVYIGNFIGAVFIALLCIASGVMEPLKMNVIETAVEKSMLSPLGAFVRGYLCNMLVCLGVWGASAAKRASGKIMTVYLPIVVFVLAGFENCTTNMYFLTEGLFTSLIYNEGAEALTILLGFIKNMIPVSVGNLLGGMTIGILYNFAQDEEDDDKYIQEYEEKFGDDPDAFADIGDDELGEEKADDHEKSEEINEGSFSEKEPETVQKGN